jgi:hypothetical protein
VQLQTASRGISFIRGFPGLDNTFRGTNELLPGRILASVVAQNEEEIAVTEVC